MLDDGVDGLRARPVRRHAPVLKVEDPVARNAHIGGRDLRLVPPYSNWGAPAALPRDRIQPVLVYQQLATLPLALRGRWIRHCGRSAGESGRGPADRLEMPHAPLAAVAAETDSASSGARRCGPAHRFRSGRCRLERCTCPRTRGDRSPHRRGRPSAGAAPATDQLKMRLGKLTASVFRDVHLQQMLDDEFEI
jgi:hypothetical protein